MPDTSTITSAAFDDMEVALIREHVARAFAGGRGARFQLEDLAVGMLDVYSTVGGTRAARVAAYACEETARIELHANDPAAAQYWAQQSAALAEEAGDGDLAALARVRQADALRRTRSDVARLVAERARKGAGPWTTVLIESTVSRSCAQRGWADQAGRALDAMDAALEHATRAEPRPDWAYGFWPAAIQARTWQFAGRYRAASRWFELCRQAQREPKDRALMDVGIAECALELDRVDQAADHAVSAATVLGDGDHGREHHRIRRLYERMPVGQARQQLGDALGDT